MITPKEKLKVFISSACGEDDWKQKYNYVRAALKELIESTGFARVYAFELEGASPTLAGQHFINAVEDCDVCIFLIDNADGVSDAVLTEFETAKKHNKKSFFYFCDQHSKEETRLQKSLKGAQYAKSETIHDFTDIIKKGTTNLVDDLIDIYKQYCKGRLDWSNEAFTMQKTNVSDIEFIEFSDSVAPKGLLANIDCCVNYFTKLIFSPSYDRTFDEVIGVEKKTGVMDELCEKFLSVLFEGIALNEIDLASLLAEIEKNQSEQHFVVTKTRYEAIKEYYCGNQEACISKLKEALQTAKSSSLPEWLRRDILIDIRNQEAFYNERRNVYRLSEYQGELDGGKTLLHYPILDRLDSNFYQGIVSRTIEHETQALGTITMGHGLDPYIESLASVYVLAMYNGSLSHLQLLYVRIRHIVFYCASRYSDWNIRKLLLKTTIIEGGKKEVEGIMRRFGDLRSKMNGNDARDIYSFANNRPIQHQKIRSKLEAFRITAYYMYDDQFNFAWTELHEFISQWIDDDNLTVSLGYNIFATLEDVCLRISQNQLIEIICKCISKKMRKFYDELFKLIRDCVDLERASLENASNLLRIVIDIVKSSDERKSVYSLDSTLVALRKKYRAFTEELDKVIAEEIPDFHNGTYRLETFLDTSEDMSTFLEKYIAQVCSENETQGKGGTFFGFAVRAHSTIKTILQRSNTEFSEDMLDSVFKVTCDTLLSDSQTIEAKIDALELLVYLIKTNPEIKQRNVHESEELLQNKSTIETASSIMSNLRETNLQFSALFLYSCLGENVIEGVLESLARIGDDASSNLSASKTTLNYLEADSALMLEFQLEHIILQQAIIWTEASTLQIRCNVVLILFSLLRNESNKNIICNQLVKLMDNDDVYIKTRILRKIHLVKGADIETYKYIIQKGTVDTNFVVRQVANEVQSKKNS